ncbi:Transcriptional regulatory protein YehT [Thalassocella blandensis]|nr:Transcriptional regulatory protein YehT [Thalassocella blandensis]
MVKLKTIIVDDEPLALGVLKSWLVEFPEIELVAECKNGREAIDATLELNPDLMFLDIQMPGKNGFEVVKELQNDIMPMVVFVTTHQQYALDAFDLHAVDYVPKPLDEERLQRAVKRAIERYEASQLLGDNKIPVIGAIDSILERAEFKQIEEDVPEIVESSSKKIAINDSGKMVLVDVNDIEWVDAAGDYMCVHANGNTHIMRSTLKELLNKLDQDVFMRIHRSTIVNLNRVQEIKHHAKGDYFLTLSCGERLKISRNYNDIVKAFRERNK